MERCPNCSTTLKKGLMKTNELLSKEKINFINDFHEEKKEGYCSVCGKEKFEEASGILNKEYNSVNSFIRKNIKNIPVISIHTPLNWDYVVLGIVTGQTTTGTGVVAEFTSSFTDFFGKQSGAYNKKLAQGEILAMAQLRAKTIELGGNAIIAADLDYSEVGSVKGMLMVCATGTAIKLKNVNVLGEKVLSAMNELNKNIDRLEFLKSKYSSYLYK